MAGAQWSGNGKFLSDDGGNLLPIGGVDIALDAAATDDDLRDRLRRLRAAGMNFVRLLPRTAGSASGMAPAVLDAGGALSGGLASRVIHLLDIAAEVGVGVHLVALPEPGFSVYMSEDAARRAAKESVATSAHEVPRHRARFRDPDLPRAGYDTFFTDADVLACQRDYLRELATLAHGHRALWAVEVYDQQQWAKAGLSAAPGDGHFIWAVRDDELRWTQQVVSTIRELFPGMPVGCSLGSFGIPGPDPLLWAEHVPCDFFAARLDQGLGGTPPRLDFAGMLDVLLKYVQPGRPAMPFGFIPGDFGGLGTDGTEAERLVLRDAIWFALLDNCPGVGVGTDRSFGEFEVPTEVMRELGFSHLRPKSPAIAVNVHDHVKFFRDAEAHPSLACRLPLDVRCPHRPRDPQHRYCAKVTSPQLADLYEWGTFALRHGVSYEFTRSPERFAQTWDVTRVSDDALKSIPRPFVPSEGCHLKYLSSADDRAHVVYVRNFCYLKVGEHAGRIKPPPRPVAVAVDLPARAAGREEYAVEVWNLDARTKAVRKSKSADTIELGVTADDFALVFRAAP